MREPLGNSQSDERVACGGVQEPTAIASRKMEREFAIQILVERDRPVDRR